MKAVLSVLLLVLAVFTPHAYGDDAQQALAHWKEMSQDIRQRLETASGLYANKKYEEAFEAARSAYFEVFENLEGPIRINVSARTNAELELQFVELRNHAQKNDLTPKEFRITARRLADGIDAAIAEMGSDVTVLKADPSENAQQAADLTLHPTTRNNPWKPTLEALGQQMLESLKLAEGTQWEKASHTLERIQFDIYKNTLLETRIRTGVSQKEASGINEDFTHLRELLQNHVSSPELADAYRALHLRIVDAAQHVQPPEGYAGENLTPPEGKSWRVIAETLLNHVKEVAELSQSQPAQAARKIQDLYFDEFESTHLEAAIGAQDAHLKSQIESHFGALHAQMRSRKGPELTQALAKIQTDLERDLNVALAKLENSTTSAFSQFVSSYLLILREGFEALLVITALVAWLIKSGNAHRLKVIWSAFAAAIALSFLTAWGVQLLFAKVGEAREILEGLTMLLAAIVLLAVSHWLFSKSTQGKWNQYIRSSVGQSLQAGSLGSLWLAAFLAVYREGAETVLFYQALLASSKQSGHFPLLAGLTLGAITLFVLYHLMKKSALKLPLKPFFIGTGSLLIALAFVFAGNGVFELIEGRLFAPTPIPGFFSAPSLGIHPYWETLTPQLLLLLLLAISIYWTLARKARLTTN